MLAANLAADLVAWCRLLGLYDCEDLKDAEPDTLRYRLLSLPARRSATPRPSAEDQPQLALEGAVPDLLAGALCPARTRLTATPSPRPGKEAPRRSRSGCRPGTPGRLAIRCEHRKPAQHDRQLTSPRLP